MRVEIIRNKAAVRLTLIDACWSDS